MEEPTITITELYFELSRIYACKYGDTAHEIQQSKAELARAADAGVTHEIFVEKMKQLREASGDFQSKLSTHILNRYWEKEFTKPITHKPFIPE